MAATDKPTLYEFVAAHAAAASAVCTDEDASCEGLKGYRQETAQRKAGEYVRGTVHTNGIESFRPCSSAAIPALAPRFRSSAYRIGSGRSRTAGTSEIWIRPIRWKRSPTGRSASE